MERKMRFRFFFRPGKINFAAVLAVLFFLPAFLHSQEQILVSYQRSFMRAGLAGKANILLDAVNDDMADQFIGDLYEFALRYVLDHGQLLRSDSEMINLAVTAARGAGRAVHAASTETLWNVFLVFRDSHTRVEVLRSLEAIGKAGNSGLVVENLNGYLLDRSRDFRAGIISPDFQVFEAAISTLSSMGDSSSYPAIFSVAHSLYPMLFQESCRALESIPGDLTGFLLNEVRNGTMQEKLTALRIAEQDRNLPSSDKGEIAELSLGYALMLSEQDAVSILLRREAIKALTALNWTKASPMAIRHFHMSHDEYDGGLAPREYYMEAIACLGAMGDFESSQTLALQLGYINSETQQGWIYDEGVLLALIRTLGETGDKAAFDYLLYISYLNYSDRIKDAAREALTRLRW